MRTYILIALRVILTLIIEGVVLYAFGFRQKRTYLVFLIVNLLTQGFLNYSFTGPNLSYIWWVKYIVIEICIVAVELILFELFIKEKGPKVNFVLVANLLSLLVGGYVISSLPI